LFGYREKDKAEDMYDLMATIGFAMASGESPNAMKNIADAFLVGAQMKRADKKEAKADERAIQKLAYQTILNQDATAAEQKAARDLLEEKYGYMEDLETLKAELNPASQTSKPPSLEKAILDAIGDAAQAKSAPLTEDEIQKVTDTVIRIYQGNYQTGTASGKTPGQAQTLADIPTNDKTGG
jgi:membrane-associated HD superfamily phosphohydrolase